MSATGFEHATTLLALAALSIVPIVAHPPSQKNLQAFSSIAKLFRTAPIGVAMSFASPPQKQCYMVATNRCVAVYFVNPSRICSFSDKDSAG